MQSSTDGWNGPSYTPFNISCLKYFTQSTIRNAVLSNWPNALKRPTKQSPSTTDLASCSESKLWFWSFAFRRDQHLHEVAQRSATFNKQFNYFIRLWLDQSTKMWAQSKGVSERTPDTSMWMASIMTPAQVTTAWPVSILTTNNPINSSKYPDTSPFQKDQICWSQKFWWLLKTRSDWRFSVRSMNWNN